MNPIEIMMKMLDEYRDENSYTKFIMEECTFFYTFFLTREDDKDNFDNFNKLLEDKKVYDRQIYNEVIDDLIPDDFDDCLGEGEKKVKISVVFIAKFEDHICIKYNLCVDNENHKFKEDSENVHNLLVDAYNNGKINKINIMNYKIREINGITTLII